ncbi:MAG: hypothetical protein M3Z28_07580 [Candidatus Dormibacteraeota bacterium]|nr:hypothetical protein [Candidatus Dormibacteraeota bacterium]
MLTYVGRQSGQSVIGIFLGLSLLFGSGVATLQFAGLGLRSLQLQEAATAGATTLAHGLRVGDPNSEPCWQAADGLQRPAAYSEAETCRAILAHLGSLDAERATVHITQTAPDAQGRPYIFTVAITYRDPVTSPLLRLILGPTFTSTSQATVLGQ